jgi:hypothetical protein
MVAGPDQFYRLGPGDTIEIELLGELASRSSAVVGPDGKIYFALLPGTFVWGLTLSETKKVLQEGMQKFFRDPPLMTLSLRGVTSQRVWILGQIPAPGIYPLSKPLTLLEAISLAGGSASAGVDLRNSFVMREANCSASIFTGFCFRRFVSKHLSPAGRFHLFETWQRADCLCIWCRRAARARYICGQGIAAVSHRCSGRTHSLCPVLGSGHHSRITDKPQRGLGEFSSNRKGASAGRVVGGG